ncbi:hypothetical protein [Corynebacterium sp.]|uniref:hypothetical protein n=1 Tax=Corynebacterium sp. TaxID=1720 RepID=UPI0026DBF005|nr:hypothetical protein [Corynebacterium sp.]MDO5076253.1 hypothetical protein [Corynebacterium sp.]
MNRYVSVAVAVIVGAWSLPGCGLTATNSVHLTAQNSSSSFTGEMVQCAYDEAAGSIRVLLDDMADEDRPSLIEIAYANDAVDLYADRSGLVVEAKGVPARKQGEEIVFDAETTFKDGRSGKVKGSFRCVGTG